MDENRWRLVVRQLSGRITAEDEETLAALLRDAGETHPDTLQELIREIWTVDPPPTHPGDPEAAVARLRARIGLDPGGTGPGLPPSSVSSRVRGVLVRAALLAGVSLLGLEVLTDLRSPTPDPPETVQALTPTRQVIAPRGEPRLLVLADGSKVVLAPSSRIRFPSRFTEGLREVRLEGSAFFSVEPDRARPFRVRSGAATTRVLGTRFVVRAYPEENAVEVSVEEGRVALGRTSAPSAGATLGPGDLGLLEGGEVRRVPGAAEPGLAWLQGRLVFRDAPVARVLAELSRWFETDFSAETAVLDRVLTTTVDTETPGEIVSILETALGAEAVLNDNSVHFVSRREWP